ncbi:TauD/TfdA dioxygenase family protein [Janibacter sp. YB324]|uniref:TauD/TfdA dioxygenase family protein n=1 Tax=Janibacter sp. YB324 TaxID=2761047 RepID=UPI00351C72D2
MRQPPRTGERGLYLGGFVSRFVGLSKTASRDILCLLQSYVTRPENVVRVVWEPDQLVIFDHQITQRYAPDNYDGLPRRLERVTVAVRCPSASTASAAARSRGTPRTTRRRSDSLRRATT